jgi:YesN/AraC family two-component response regulator
MEQKKACCSDIIKAELLKLLISAYRELQFENSPKHDSNTWKESVVQDVVNYIKANYSKYIRLVDVSQLVCISPNYLNSIFKAVTGKTIMQYHEDYRIDIAKKFLREPKYSINDISHKLGFYDQYHFSKIFKKVIGVSPSSYRNQP